MVPIDVLLSGSMVNPFLNTVSYSGEGRHKCFTNISCCLYMCPYVCLCHTLLLKITQVTLLFPILIVLHVYGTIPLSSSFFVSGFGNFRNILPKQTHALRGVLSFCNALQYTDEWSEYFIVCYIQYYTGTVTSSPNFNNTCTRKIQCTYICIECLIFSRDTNGFTSEKVWEDEGTFVCNLYCIN